MGKLLIIADASGKRGIAVARGLELARRLGHSAEVVAFAYAPLTRLKIKASEHAGIKKRLLDEYREVVQGLIDKHAADGQKVSFSVSWEKDVVGWVNKRCAKTDYEAVIKTASRSGSLVYTPTEWQLLRECSAPVLLVAESRWSRTKPVLAAIDLGTSVRSKRALNNRILQQAKFLANALDAELRIIAAIEIPALLADMDLVDPVAYTKAEREAMDPEIKALASAHELPEQLFRVKRGPVEKVIASRAAKVGAQIVVMGTVGRKGVKARLLGNTAEKVLSHMKTDVLAIKP